MMNRPEKSGAHGSIWRSEGEGSNRRGVVSSLIVIALVSFAIIAIGWFDFMTGWEVSLLILYAIPVGLSVWWVGFRAGLLAAGLSGVAWWMANRASQPYETEIGYAWATMSRLFYFGVVAFAVATARRRQRADAARIQLLETRQQLESDIVKVSEYEQRRIGQDLHDGLCQMLAAIACAARTLGEELKSKNLPEAEDAWLIERSVAQSAAEARLLARGIFPVHVDKDGLAVGLAELARITSQLTGGAIVFSDNVGECSLNNSSAMHLYRIAQESVANALKHGGASEVRVQLDREGDTLILTIEDNGGGIKPNTGVKPQRSKGMGMRVMEYRARTMGASLDIQSRPGSGVRVVCRMPLSVDNLAAEPDIHAPAEQSG